MSSKICSDFVTQSCEDFCVRVADGTHDSPKETPDGKMLVTSKNVKGGRLSLDSAYFISLDDFNTINKRSKVDQWDLLLTMIGTVGEVCLVDQAKPDFAIKNVGLLKCGDELRGKWLYYFLRSPQGQGLIEQRKKGSTQQYISLAEIRKLPISYPRYADEMKAALDTLSSLDNRIILLRETNATLEAIAQALFKSWFVDFDPVCAKAEGLEPEGMDAATATLFPDSFEESELGLVPRGWKAGCVADIAVQKKGSVNPLASPNEWFEHYSLPAFDSGQSPVLEHGESIKSNKTPLPEEAVLLSKLNPHIPRVWLPVKHGGNAVCSTEFLAYSPKAGGSKELIYCLFSSAEFQQQLCQLVTGTSNSHQRVKPDQVLKLRLAIADDSLFIAFADIASPIFERVYANRLKAQTLTKLRDTLLPRLISGQLRLPETDASVENMLSEAV